MSFTRAPQITSSQTTVHKNLAKVVERYLNNEYQDSIPKHAHDAFNIANEFVKQRNSPVILDSGCGTGESTHYLAEKYPDRTIIGIDKSSARLKRNTNELLPNQLLIHTDCIHFWRLAHQYNWQLDQHYLLYPNPWPKPGHLQRRWHAHPVFPVMLKLGGTLTLRTNWNIYALEFAQALKIILDNEVEVKNLEIDHEITAHERKYFYSDHSLFEVIINL